MSHHSCQVHLTNKAQPSTRITPDAVVEANVLGIQSRNDTILEVHPSHVGPSREEAFVAALIDVNVKQPDFK